MLYTNGWSDSFLPLLKEGKMLTITPIGTSMFPLFTDPNDQAILAYVNIEKLHRGDVILYRRNNGMLVLHRIVKKTNDTFYMTGDNQTKIEGPLYANQIYAVMAAFYRKGHLISCKNPVYMILSRLWLFLRPIRPLISRPLGMLYRLTKGNINFL